jgi:hypothetical protein
MISNNAAALKQNALKPIVSLAILERVQIDVIDFFHKADKKFKYVLHIKDYFSKFTSLNATKAAPPDFRQSPGGRCG